MKGENIVQCLLILLEKSLAKQKFCQFLREKVPVTQRYALTVAICDTRKAHKNKKLHKITDATEKLY